MGTLLVLNSVACVAQVAQAVYASTALSSSEPGTGKVVVRDNGELVGSYKLGALVVAFPILSALNHGFSVASHRGLYAEYVDQGWNPVRWAEYSFSAGVMVLLVAQMSGVNELRLLLALVASNFLLQFIGCFFHRNLNRFCFGRLGCRRSWKRWNRFNFTYH